EPVAGKERREARARADRADARPAAAVRDAEGLVEVEVADVRADGAGAGEAALRVHVGAVHVDESAALVDDAADVAYRGFEYAVRGWIRDHQRGEALGVRVGLGLEVGEIDVALFVAGDGHDLHARHRGAGGV